MGTIHVRDPFGNLIPQQTCSGCGGPFPGPSGMCMICRDRANKQEKEFKRFSSQQEKRCEKCGSLINSWETGDICSSCRERNENKLKSDNIIHLRCKCGSCVACAVDKYFGSLATSNTEFDIRKLLKR